MTASFATTSSVVLTITVWASFYVFAVAPHLTTDFTLSSPIIRSGTRLPSPDRTKASCNLGPGKESHHVVNGSSEVWPYQVYKSSPLNPPELDITTNGQSLAPGLIFITPSDGSEVEATKDNAPMIMSDTGQLVWHGPMVSANNLRVASYQGRSILTYWNGSSGQGPNVGHGYGNVTFLDATYNEIFNVCPQLGLVTPDNIQYACEADFHESFVTDRNTLLVTAYNATRTDLSSIGGPSNGWVFDCLFFELDPKTNRILFRWSALEHISVSETKLKFSGGAGFNQSSPFDWFHINSVVNIGNKFLVNSRHLWTVYLITAEGDIEWTLQGDTGGDFGTLPTNGHFSWQHFARPQIVTNTSTTISLFNNFNALGIDNGTHPSNGLVFQLTTPPNKSRPPVVVEYLSDPSDSIYSDSQGSSSLLPNGHYFLGYGEIAILKEFAVSGANGSDILWTARFGFDNLVQSYRGYKTEWHGFPTTSPDLVVKQNDNGCYVGYVSWNGATNVEEWVVYEGRVKDRLSRIGSIGYKGFETRFIASQPCVQVAAIVGGELSTRSDVVCTSSNGTSQP